MGAMMGWMMGAGLLGWVLVIALLATIVIILVRGLSGGEPRRRSSKAGDSSGGPPLP